MPRKRSGCVAPSCSNETGKAEVLVARMHVGETTRSASCRRERFNVRSSVTDSKTMIESAATLRSPASVKRCIAEWASSLSRFSSRISFSRSSIRCGTEALAARSLVMPVTRWPAASRHATMLRPISPRPMTATGPGLCFCTLILRFSWEDYSAKSNSAGGWRKPRVSTAR